MADDGFPSEAECRDTDPNLLFIIQRNKNTNTVVYAVNKEDDGAIKADEPVNVYWIMFEKDGNPTEGLNFLERNSAYGTSSEAGEEDGHFMVTVSALKDRPLEVFLDESGAPVAQVEISGEVGNLKRIFVKSKSSMIGLPKVQYVELFGVHPADGTDVYEKIVPK